MSDEDRVVDSDGNEGRAIMHTDDVIRSAIRVAAHEGAISKDEGACALARLDGLISEVSYLREMGKAYQAVAAARLDAAPFGHVSRADETQVEACGERCDHGSECLELTGHTGGHETQHGCVFYSDARTAPNRSETNR